MPLGRKCAKLDIECYTYDGAKAKCVNALRLGPSALKTSSRLDLFEERKTHFLSAERMRDDIYEISDVPCGKLAIMPRPRAGDWLEDEVSSWRRAGLTIIVSLLEDSEILELGLEQEAAVCERAGIRFLRFPIPDRGLPVSEADVSRVVELLIEELRRNEGVGIHCRMGIGRSALLATCILAGLGLPVESAWAAVQRARGLTVPDTAAQRAWVESWLSTRG